MFNASQLMSAAIEHRTQQLPAQKQESQVGEKGEHVDGQEAALLRLVPQHADGQERAGPAAGEAAKKLKLLLGAVYVYLKRFK